MDAILDTIQQAIVLPLHHWCEDHSGRIEACYLQHEAIRNIFTVWVIDRKTPHDFELATDLFRLGDSIQHDAEVKVDCHLVGSIEGLMNPNLAHRIYGNAQSTRASGKSDR